MPTVLSKHVLTLVCNTNVSKVWGRLCDFGIHQAQSYITVSGYIICEMAVSTIVEAELSVLVVSEKPESKRIFFENSTLHIFFLVSDERESCFPPPILNQSKLMLGYHLI